jgi:glycosyltransferase involved in cell wall biosynthesis
MESVSCVMAIHNEEKYLPYSLKPLLSTNFEIIFVLDRCTDSSEKIIQKFIAKRGNCKVVYKKEAGVLTENPAFDAFLYGSQYASGKYIYWIGADFVVPRDIFKYRPRNEALKFEYIDCTNHLMYAWHKLLSKFTKHYTCEAFRKEHLTEGRYHFPSEEKITYPFTPEDKYQLISSVKLLHLRPNRNKVRHYIQGYVRRLKRVPFLRVLLHSILFNKPCVVIGYLRAMMDGK